MQLTLLTLLLSGCGHASATPPGMGESATEAAPLSETETPEAQTENQLGPPLGEVLAATCDSLCFEWLADAFDRRGCAFGALVAPASHCPSGFSCGRVGLESSACVSDTGHVVPIDVQRESDDWKDVVLTFTLNGRPWPEDFDGIGPPLEITESNGTGRFSKRLSELAGDHHVRLPAGVSIVKFLGRQGALSVAVDGRFTIDLRPAHLVIRGRRARSGPTGSIIRLARRQPTEWLRTVVPLDDNGNGDAWLSPGDWHISHCGRLREGCGHVEEVRLVEGEEKRVAVDLRWVHVSGTIEGIPWRRGDLIELFSAQPGLSRGLRMGALASGSFRAHVPAGDYSIRYLGDFDAIIATDQRFHRDRANVRIRARVVDPLVTLNANEEAVENYEIRFSRAEYPNRAFPVNRGEQRLRMLGGRYDIHVVGDGRLLPVHPTLVGRDIDVGEGPLPLSVSGVSWAEVILQGTAGAASSDAGGAQWLSITADGTLPHNLNGTFEGAGPHRIALHGPSWVVARSAADASFSLHLSPNEVTQVDLAPREVLFRLERNGAPITSGGGSLNVTAFLGDAHKTAFVGGFSEGEARVQLSRGVYLAHFHCVRCGIEGYEEGGPHVFVGPFTVR